MAPLHKASWTCFPNCGCFHFHDFGAKSELTPITPCLVLCPGESASPPPLLPAWRT